jgi:hypothetical protein
MIRHYCIDVVVGRKRYKVTPRLLAPIGFRGRNSLLYRFFHQGFWILYQAGTTHFGHIMITNLLIATGSGMLSKAIVLPSGAAQS